jgi:hypothetical protein
MITEKQYLNALDILKQYAQQVGEETSKALELKKEVQAQIDKAEFEKLKKEACNMTLDELCNHPLFDKHKILSVRVTCPMYWADLENKKICEITKNDILSVRGLGKFAWRQICNITGRNHLD